MREKEKKTMGAAAPKEEKGTEERDFASEVALLLERYPELKGKSLPEKVVLAAMDGMDLVEAYEAYLEEQSFEEISKNDATNTVEQQNQRAAKKAPVRGVSGGSAVAMQGEDDFLRGFNE